MNPGLGGNIGFGGTEGAFAPQVLVRDAAMGKNLFTLPDSIPFEIGALVEPFNVGMHAVDRSKLQSGEKVVVFGVGPIGLTIVSTLHHRGFDNVVAIDLSDHRLKLARQLGANTSLNAGQVDIWQELRDLHGAVDHYGTAFAATDVFIKASGAPVIPDILSHAKPNARLTVVAGYSKPAPVDFTDVMSKQIEIIGSYMYSADFGQPIALLDALDVGQIITHRFPLTQFSEGISAAQDSSSAGKVMIQL